VTIAYALVLLSIFNWRTTESLLLLARSSMLNRSHTLLRSAPVQAIHRGEAAHQVQRDDISGSNTYRQPDIWLIPDCHPMRYMTNVYKTRSVPVPLSFAGKHDPRSISNARRSGVRTETGSSLNCKLVDTRSHYTAIAGTGAVAKTFARFFSTNGTRISIVSREIARAQRTADEIPGVEACTYENLPDNLSRVLIAVPDDAITAVAARLTQANPQVAIHTSGNLGGEVLYPLSSQGTACGAMHPLQTLTGDPEDVSALRGAAFAVSGDQDAIAWARSIVDAIGGEALQISPECRAFYHAAAVMASNYVTALVDTSEFLFGEAGVAVDAARRVLSPLLRRAVENTLTRGPVTALTGPIARGDLHTVAAHLQALSSVPEDIQQLYRAAGLRTLDIAERKGLPPESALHLYTLLQPSK
jgi:predicted short-subunit dehydrogenase-like oxidoreductase (DUF2520 family)